MVMMVVVMVVVVMVVVMVMVVVVVMVYWLVELDLTEHLSLARSGLVHQ